MPKILHVANAKSVFIKNLVSLLSDMEHVILDVSGNSTVDIGCPVYTLPHFSVKKPWTLFKARRFANNLLDKEHPDVVFFHSKYWILWFSVGEVLKKRNIPVVAPLWGTMDYLGKPLSWGRERFHRKIVESADILTVPTKYHVPWIYHRYSLETLYKVSFAKFPTLVRYLDDVSEKDIAVLREQLVRERNRIIITVGQKAALAPNHIRISLALSLLPKDLRENIFVIYPMTYGDTGYRKKVEEFLKRHANFEYVVLKEYMPVNVLAALKHLVDIEVLLFKMDSFSAALQEALYAGSVVITGSWLPYQEIIDRGGYMEFVDSLAVNAISQKLRYVIRNIDSLKQKTRVNKRVIEALNDEEEIRSQWMNAIEKAISRRRRR